MDEWRVALHPSIMENSVMGWGGGGGLILPRKLRSNRVKHAIRYLNNQEDCNINEANFYVRNLTFKETVVDYFSNLVLI